MMRDEQPSPLRATLRLVLDEVRRKRGGADAAGGPRRRPAVECRAVVIDPARARRFLAVTGGASLDRGPEGDGRLPPTLSALWEVGLSLELLGVSGIPLPYRGILHQESELVSIRPVSAGEPLRCRVELDRMEPHPRGARLLLKSRAWNAAGQLCQENALTLVACTSVATGRDRAAPEPDGPTSGGAEPRQWRVLTEWPLSGGLGRRYARVSGDYNPVHLWGWSARLLGFERPILHGFCAEAMTAHALIAHLFDGDPAALRRLRVSFRAPIPLPTRVRLEVSDPPASGGRRFRLSGEESARPYAEGEFVGGRGG